VKRVKTSVRIGRILEESHSAQYLMRRKRAYQFLGQDCCLTAGDKETFALREVLGGETMSPDPAYVRWRARFMAEAVK
jgi:hypothetical protein